MAISTTLFLFIHTRELHTKLKAMEVKLQPEDMLSGKFAPNPFGPFRALTQISAPLLSYTSNFHRLTYKKSVEELTTLTLLQMLRSI
jgi:hypothetical protein